jgi:hypothetical protein
MKHACVLVPLLALAASATSAQGKLTNEEALRRFVGVWTLVRWEETLADGTKREHPVSAGHIIYSDIGRMCAVVMDPNRPKWRSTAPTPEEALAGMNSRAFYAYCATAEMHADEGYVLHHTIIDKVPNSVGAIRKRWFAFQGPNRVLLRIDRAELPPDVVESALVWERVVEQF